MLERKKVEFLWKGGFLCLGIESYVYLIAVLFPSCGKWKQYSTFVSRNKRVFCLFFCVCVCWLSFDLFCLFLALNCNLFLLGLYGKDIGVS